MNNDLSNTIRKIEALITKADHENTSPIEAGIFRAKAEALMFKYRIDEMQVNASGEAPAPGSVSPQWDSFIVCDAYSEFRGYYRGLIDAVVRHFDARVEYEREDTNVVARIVGYESDLRFVGVLWQSIRLGFSGKLEPKFDPAVSEEENCYRMRNAGMEGARIALAVFKDGSKAKRVLARKYARKFAESIGEDPSVFSGQGNDMKSYRASYAQGFYSTMTGRLRTMAEGRIVENAGALVLASRAENVNEAFYARYPNRKPKPIIETASESTMDIQAKCKKCQKAKSGYCREHGWMKPRAIRGGVRYNAQASQRGSAAARDVSMGGDRKVGR